MSTDLSYEATSRTIQLRDGRLHYHEAGDGQPLVFLHGSGPGVNGWLNFQGNLPTFAKHFRCFILDMPGYGESEAVPGDPVQTAVVATAEFVDKLNLGRVAIIGNSLGGLIASHFAVQHPQKLSRLCAVGGIGYNLFSPFPNEGINLLVSFTEEPTRERLAEWLRSMVYDPSILTPEILDERWNRAMRPEIMEVSRRIYARAAMQARTAAVSKSFQHIADIQCPVLLLWGRDDRVSTIDAALVPMRMIPECELHTFPRCGHWVMIEQKEAFEGVALAFLRRP